MLLAAGAALTAGAAGALTLVEADVLPGGGRLDRVLGRCDVPVPQVPRGRPGPLVTAEFDSAKRRTRVGYAIVYPPGHVPGDPLPVCLTLHGFGGSGRDSVMSGGFASYLTGWVAGGGAPFALAGPDGGGGYWHPHATDDPLGMLLDEFLPLLAARGLRVERPAVAGWSMGGYGALVCALTAPRRFAAVVASSPAIFGSYEDAHRTNPGAFGSAAEWEAYDVVSRKDELTSAYLRVDIGESDPFAAAVRGLPSVTVTKGCHDNDYWIAAAPAQVAFVGAALGQVV
jgi:S-formylglutathione hydrolase FrmB